MWYILCGGDGEYACRKKKRARGIHHSQQKVGDKSQKSRQKQTVVGEKEESPAKTAKEVGCQPLIKKWLTNRKAAAPRGFSYVLSVITAATENKDQRQNDDPGAAIVKGVAETVVVIHMRSSLKIRDVLPTLPSYVGGWGSVHAVPRRSPWRCGRFATANPVRRAPRGGRQGSDARHFSGKAKKIRPNPLQFGGRCAILCV